ncbi:RcnB family protein [Sphingomonas sp. 3-13AW]|jgi:Ni/Co efflux regulator RcnB|uniref:RcnB family protein n=1 Tax=Sphingomonas sp. 3-13AW TaxID=3050450 RepID=UPI003BB78C92
MRTLILAALAATTALSGIALPVAASAQPRPEYRDHRDDRRYDNRRHEAQRHHARPAPRAYPRDHRWGRNDWRAYRQENRRLYARGGWQAPFGYSGFRAGARIAPNYYGPRYVIADPWRYRLPPVRPGQRWVRHYDDVVLVDTRRGRVIDVIRGFYW